MKTSIPFDVLLASLLWVDFARAQSVDLHWTSPVNERHVTFYAEPQGKAPEEMAVLVEPDNPDVKFRSDWEKEAQTNHNLIPQNRGVGFEIFDDFKKAKWIPFKTNLLVDLGPGDGGRWLRVSFKSRTDKNPRWDSHFIVVQSSPCFVGITYPKQKIISQPMILLKGFSPVPVRNIKYEVLDQNGKSSSSGEGLVNDQYYDPVLHYFTTNKFTCYYINLSLGTNTIILSCEDLAGNQTVTNLTYVLNFDQDRTPPVISIDYPPSGLKASGDSFAARGQLDDATERIVGLIFANGHTNIVDGLVEWSRFVDGAGYFWVENIPLALGTNYLTLTATDAAGNSSSTNLILFGVEGPQITMDPILPADQLWQPFINVTGKVSPASHGVWINGVQAKVKPDGTWLAQHVPVVSPNIGTACFELSAFSPEEMTNGTVKLAQVVSAQASLSTNAMILNASFPACGVFELHLTETAGRSFVLQASTNLVEWVSILTNSNPNATFDYTDTNANNYHCRYFRVVPWQ